MNKNTDEFLIKLRNYISGLNKIEKILIEHRLKNVEFSEEQLNRFKSVIIDKAKKEFQEEDLDSNDEWDGGELGNE